MIETTKCDRSARKKDLSKNQNNQVSVQEGGRSPACADFGC